MTSAPSPIISDVHFVSVKQNLNLWKVSLADVSFMFSIQMPFARDKLLFSHIILFLFCPGLCKWDQSGKR